MSINIKRKSVKTSDLKHTIYNNFYFSKDKLSYDYDFYEIKDDNFLVGYIIKYNIPKTKSIEYIDIYICSNFRNNGLGTEALRYYIDNISEKESIGIISTNKDKIRFLEKNNFKFDEIYIYKNMYRFKKEGNINE